MKYLSRTACCAAMAALLCLTLAACSSKTNQDANTESAATSGPPDLSGIWQIAAPIEKLTTVDGKMPPLLPDAMKLYEERIAQRAAGKLTDDPAQKCKPLGEPRAMLEMGWPFQIAQGPQRIDILYQYNRLDHAIFMTDTHTKLVGPFYFGESIGKWEGDTLVVDVVNVHAGSWLDPAGLPHSDNLHMVERFRLVDDKLEVSFHFEDPQTYSQPWDAVLTFVKKPDLRIVEDVCTERVRLDDYYYTLDNSLK